MLEAGVLHLERSLLTQVNEGRASKGHSLVRQLRAGERHVLLKTLSIVYCGLLDVKEVQLLIRNLQFSRVGRLTPGSR